ncbi:MAG: hypothetical protein ABI867_43690 [Kofleriaceae bacterium]
MGQISSCALVLVGAACDPNEPPAPLSTPSHAVVAVRSLALDVEIATQLSARVGATVSVQCTALPPACTATLPDRVRVPIRLELRHDGWRWSLEGLLVTSDPIERYLRDALLDLGALQAVSCGPRIRLLERGDRIVCTLEHAGKAFVSVSGDGTFAVEIELDALAAAARAESIDPGGLGDAK